MASRLELHNDFIDVLGTKNEAESRVYFRSPESKKMKYPCIKYNQAEPHVKRANNSVYDITNKYEGIVIDYDPDSKIPTEILMRFPMCSLGKPYTADNLNHFPFTLYY